MANLAELEQWEAGIRQFETEDVVEGGVEGVDNIPLRQLANRTAWLKAQILALGDNKQPLDGTLTALAALATVADRIIYSTGPDTFAQTPITAFIRTLLDDADAAAARVTLGAISQAQLDAAIAALVNASPAALDTLNELAAALGNDANFATTVNNSIALRLVISDYQKAAAINSRAGGTADALTGTYVPAIAALTDGMTLYVRAASANATITPTFTPNSGTIAAKTIVKGAGSALVAGDIAGGGHWIELQYDATLDKWVLINPASGLGKQTSSVQSFNSGAVNLAFNNNTVTSMTANVVMPSYSSTGKFRILGRLTSGTVFSSASGSYTFNSGLLDTTNSNAQLQGDGKSKYQGSGQGTIDTCSFFSPYLYAPGATIPLTVQFSANGAGTLSSQQLTVLVVEG